MIALVTGGTGFIGSHLLKALRNSDQYEIIYYTDHRAGRAPEDVIKIPFGDKQQRVYVQLCNKESVKEMFNYIKPNTIFHLAAKQGRTIEAFEQNVAMTSNLLQYCHTGTRFVYASSSTVYGDLAALTSRACNVENKTVPTSLYGASKLAGEALVQSYAASGKIIPLILRYVANVGLGATHGLLPDIINKLKADDPEIHLLGKFPGSIKPYMHVNDTIKATLLLDQGIYNISNRRPLSVLEIVQLAMAGLNKRKPIIWGGQAPPGDNPIVHLDNGPLGHEWQKYKTSQEAIVAAIEEYKDIYNQTER